VFLTENDLLILNLKQNRKFTLFNLEVLALENLKKYSFLRLFLSPKITRKIIKNPLQKPWT
jgi:hypothetical protein